MKSVHVDEYPDHYITSTLISNIRLLGQIFISKPLNKHSTHKQIKIKLSEIKTPHIITSLEEFIKEHNDDICMSNAKIVFNAMTDYSNFYFDEIDSDCFGYNEWRHCDKSHTDENSYTDDNSYTYTDDYYLSEKISLYDVLYFHGNLTGTNYDINKIDGDGDGDGEMKYYILEKTSGEHGKWLELSSDISISVENVKITSIEQLKNEIEKLHSSIISYIDNNCIADSLVA